MLNLLGGPSMAPGVVFICVWNCRAAVSRYTRVEGGIAIESATNWEALEEDAITIIEAQGGAYNMSGHYICSPDLAARATWEEVETSERPERDSGRSR